MKDVERMYRHLVRTIRTSFPQHLAQPFQVGELYQTILPYRLHRRELGFETNQDYEIALLELLTGADGYLVVDGKMRDVLKSELTSPAPDTSRIRQFASEHVALAPEAMQQELATRTPSAGGSSATISRAAAAAPTRAGDVGKVTPPLGSVSASVSSPVSDSTRRVAKPLTVSEEGEACGFCKGDLPSGRQISFCPHCGQDLTVVHCPACGSELERGWKFCVTCGRGAD